MRPNLFSWRRNRPTRPRSRPFSKLLAPMGAWLILPKRGPAHSMPARFVGMIAACLLAVCLLAMQTSGAEPVSDRSILHVLNRLAFGPTLEDFRRVKAIGIARYIA